MSRSLLLLLLAAATLAAQSISSSLTGSVLDPSGASIGGATVTLRDLDRQTTLSSVSTEAGVFRVNGIRPGAYELLIEKPGFQRYRVDRLAFIGNVEMNHLARLAVGTQADQVTVVAEGSLIETAAVNGVRGGTFTSSESNDLPLIGGGNGRNFRILSFQLPGVASQGSAHAPFNVNGTRAAGTMNIMVDGAEFIDFNYGRLLAQGLTEQPVSMETVEGYEMQTGNFKAEFGRASGSVSNLVTKRGTNELHGSLYTFWQNGAMNARNATLLERPPYISYTPGFTLGGPIRRNRTFFFLGGEITGRDVGSASSVIQTLTNDQKANAVPWVRPIANLFPEPNLGTNLNSASVPGPRTMRSWIAKFDHVLTDNHRLGLKYNYSKQQGNTFGRVPALNFSSANGNQMYVVNLDSSFGPRALNQVKASYVHYDNAVRPGNVLLGDPNVNGILGGVTITGLQNLWSVFRWPRETTTHNYNISDDFTFSTGRHILKAGGIHRRLQSNTVNDQNFNGWMIFTSVNDFLNGNPVNYQRAFGVTRTDQRGNEFGFYFQDDWRFSPNLTLNLGVRYETYAPYREKFQRIPTPHSSDLNNIMPRLGFAYNVKGQSKTVVRGGFGMFYNALFLDIIGQTRFNPPLVSTFSNAFPFRPGLRNVNRPDFLGNAVLSSNVTRIDPNLVNPYGLNWNLTVERQMFHPSSLLSVAYVGSKGNSLARNRRPNGGDNLAQNLRPDRSVGIVNYFDSSSNSNYHSFQASYRAILARRVTMRASYTFSKAIDDVSDATGIFPVDERNLRLDRGRSDFDQPHLLTASAIYTLPFFAKSALLGGWQVSGTMIRRTALPFSILSNTNNFNGSLINRVNDIPGTILRGAQANSFLRLAPGTAFASLQPAAGATGTLGRNTERGDNFQDVSLSLQKSFRITEGIRAEFRMEASNALNVVNYSAPINNVANANFGRSLNAQDPRQVQFALRLVF
jgi:hypothetical protein